MAVLAPSHDGRAVAYGAVVAVLVPLALAAGLPALVAFAAPFGVALVLGLRRRGPEDIEASLTLDRATLLEGDEVEATLRVRCRSDLRVVVRIGTGLAITVAPDSPSVVVLAPGERTATVRLVAHDWGRHVSARLSVAARLPAGLVEWEGAAGVGDTVRVLPRPVRVRQLLDPARPRAIAGLHPSRSIGDGVDFAEIRPWAPGDRVRTINRRASARRGAPHVNRYHPDRTGDVVLLVDTFGDAASSAPTTVSRDAVARAARAAWALAQLHLAAQDRVGFLASGRVGAWLPPGGGDRARYRLLATFLDLGADVADGTTRWGLHPERLVPRDALVLAFTPLWRPQSIAPLVNLRRAGCHVGAVVIDTSDLGDAPVTAEEHLARRLWTLQLDDRCATLGEGGVPHARWPVGGEVGHAVARLRALERRSWR